MRGLRGTTTTAGTGTRGSIHAIIWLVASTVLVVVLVGAASSSPADSATRWDEASEASIHPGVMTFTEGAQCTANFIFTDGQDIYIGQSAHCASTDGSTATDGCDAATRPIGTPVEIDGASQPGVLAYSSWETMQAEGERDGNTCSYNDFALVRIDPADHDRVNPSVPHWGGPEGLTTSTSSGEPVYSYGNSSLRLGLSALSPKQGYSLGQSAGGWLHTVYTVTPGVPGDSGSGFLSSTGDAFGVLSTVAIAPLAASNGVTDLSRALEYMQRHADGFADVQLVPGTESF